MRFEHYISMIIIIVISAAMLSGCATTGVGATSSSPPQALIGDWLLDAEQAASDGNMTLLAQLVRKLENEGVQPQDGMDDPMPRWRKMAAAELAAMPPYRGRALGPAYRRGTLAAGQKLTVNQTFLAGQNASVSLSSTNSDKVLLTISDKDQKRKCEAARKCRWMPLFTQRYEISLINRGGKSANYYLVVN
ncbi:hypothetical protein ACFOWX_06560 [Sphingorhabdus arenilitoris]|uniref:Lipoprotein n=1 Tax=Sphingorhabdus arenilitoris TaxID=1490041 RepID=A0ABV8RFV6_9SPHN